VKLAIALVFLLIGIGRNLPFPEMYFFGLGLGDFALVMSSLLLLIDSTTRHMLVEAARNLWLPISLVFLLAIWAFLSYAFNTFLYGTEIKDFFEILKYIYSAMLMVVTFFWTKKFGAWPILWFATGVVISGIVAFFNPMNPDVLGTRQIFNPNVIGNVLAVSIGLCSLGVVMGSAAFASAIAALAAILGFFTFSKGTWLMMLFSLVAMFVALVASAIKPKGLIIKLGKVVAVFVLLGLIGVAYTFRDTVYNIVEAKIVATEFDATAEEGGSFSARAGLMLSAYKMFLMNPFLGVGISNYEKVHRSLERELGSAFYDDDNPNSAFFYVLGCMGFPAFAAFVGLFGWLFSRMTKLAINKRRNRWIFAAAFSSTLFIGGNVQVEMLTAYYYWVTLGAVAAASMKTPEIADGEIA